MITSTWHNLSKDLIQAWFAPLIQVLQNQVFATSNLSNLLIISWVSQSPWAQENQWPKQIDHSFSNLAPSQREKFYDVSNPLIRSLNKVLLTFPWTRANTSSLDFGRFSAQSKSRTFHQIMTQGKFSQYLGKEFSPITDELLIYCWLCVCKDLTITMGLALHQQADYSQSLDGLHAIPLTPAEVYGTKDP